MIDGSVEVDMVRADTGSNTKLEVLGLDEKSKLQYFDGRQQCAPSRSILG